MLCTLRGIAVRTKDKQQLVAIALWPESAVALWKLSVWLRPHPGTLRVLFNFGLYIAAFFWFMLLFPARVAVGMLWDHFSARAAASGASQPTHHRAPAD